MPHLTHHPIGLLVTNVGTPDDPSPEAVRRFLAEFLTDEKVIDYPRWLWLSLLHGIILNIRPRKSARLYQRIWTKEGSPLLGTTQKIAEGLENRLLGPTHGALSVRIGMRYGSPSLGTALQAFQEDGIERILVFPLFPQYSQTTTATTVDAVQHEIRRLTQSPEMRWVHDYHDHPQFIQALANSIRRHKRNSHKLLLSYHGVPRRYTRAGDPYLNQCLKTSELLAGHLGLADGEWSYAFQSRFGPEEWLQPYTDETLAGWGQQGLTGVSVLCPGFATDCLETLDEIANEGKHAFLAAGGTDFQYIPALNDDEDHIRALAQIAKEHLGDWLAG